MILDDEKEVLEVRSNSYISPTVLTAAASCGDLVLCAPEFGLDLLT